MTQAARARAPQSGDAASPRRPSWAGPLVAGLAFGLTYGITQRLVSLNVGELIRFGQGFDVQVFPGTSLESLRLRFGAADSELRGNLELQELERGKRFPTATSYGGETEPSWRSRSETESSPLRDRWPIVSGLHLFGSVSKHRTRAGLELLRFRWGRTSRSTANPMNALVACQILRSIPARP